MIKINRIYVSLLIAPIFLFILFSASCVKAEDFYYIESIPKERSTDFFLESANIKINVPLQALKNDIWIRTTNIVPQEFIGSYFSFPENLGPLSDLYSIRFKEESNFTKNPKITVKFPKGNKSSQLYYYNWGNLAFEKIDAVKNMASSTFTFDYPAGKDFLMFAVFGEPEYKGKASWYVHPKYKGQLIVASTMYPNGTKLKVTNLENNKEVIVVVRDYGPDPIIHPDRVVDLSKEAFAVIAKTSQGVINVKVTKE